MKTSARSLKYLHGLGYESAVTVERRVPPGITIDLWNFIDILVLDDHPGVLGVQACSSSDLNPHIKKIQDNPFAPIFLQRNNRLQIQAWRKVYKKGTKIKKWIPRIVDVSLKDGILVFSEQVKDKVC